MKTAEFTDPSFTAGIPFTFNFDPSTVFANAGTTYTMTKSDDTALPGWLSATWTSPNVVWSGTYATNPAVGTPYTITVKVLATDTNSFTAFETFIITITNNPAVVQVSATLTDY